MTGELMLEGTGAGGVTGTVEGTVTGELRLDGTGAGAVEGTLLDAGAAMPSWAHTGSC